MMAFRVALTGQLHTCAPCTPNDARLRPIVEKMGTAPMRVRPDG